MEYVKEYKYAIVFLLVISFLLLWFFWHVRTVLTPFVLGLMLSYITIPVKFKLEKVFSGTGAALITTLLLVFFMVALLMGVVPMVYHEVIVVLKSAIAVLEKGEYFKFETDSKLLLYLRHYISEIRGYVIENSTHLLKGALSGIFSSGKAITSVVSTVAVTPFITFFILQDYTAISSGVRLLIPEKYKDVTENFMSEVHSVLARCLRGQLQVCIWVGLYYCIALSVAGFHSGVALGIFAGLMTFVPYVGYSLVVIFVTLAKISAGSPSVVYLLLILIIGGLFESYIISPKFLTKYTKLNPVWIIFALMVGGYMLGFLGLLIAIPVAAVSRSIIHLFVQKYLRSDFYVAM